MMNDNHFTKDAYEDNGRFQIHPLSPEGLEAYLSKDSYNYHYLSSKYDPALIKEIQEEIRLEKEKKLNENENNIKNEEKNEDKKIENIKEQNAQNINKNMIEKKSNQKINKKVENKMVKKGNNNANKKKVVNSSTQKINNIGKSINPVISNVRSDRGKLGDYQQPYHA